MGLRTKKTISMGKRKHAVYRAKQRFHLDLNKSARKRFRSTIKKGKATLIQKLHDNRVLYDVPYDGEIYRIVYNTKTNFIVTVLPEESKRKYKDK